MNFYLSHLASAAGSEMAACISVVTYVIILIGLHFWWPRLTSHRFPRALSIIGLLLLFTGILFIVGPMIVVGYLGMPRSYHAHPGKWPILDMIDSTGGMLLAAAYLLLAGYLLWSRRSGAFYRFKR